VVHLLPVLENTIEAPEKDLNLPRSPLTLTLTLDRLDPYPERKP